MKGDRLRIPKALRRDAEQVFGLTDPFCAEFLDKEYGLLCRKMVAALARKRPSPFARGDLTIWAAAVIYTVGSVNFLFDKDQTPHMTGDEIARLTGVPKSTLANKAKVIRRTLRLRPMDVAYRRREMVENHPMAWLIRVNGVVVDARDMPIEIRDEARRRGLIPTLATDLDEPAGNPA